MNNYRKFSEYIYLVISFVSIFEYFFGENSSEKNNIFLIMAVFSFGMFLFRRHYRIKFKNRDK
jgi:hypothetical protein